MERARGRDGAKKGLAIGGMGNRRFVGENNVRNDGKREISNNEMHKGTLERGHGRIESSVFDIKAVENVVIGGLKGNATRRMRVGSVRRACSRECTITELRPEERRR